MHSTGIHLNKRLAAPCLSGPSGELTLCFTSQVLAEFFSIVTSVKRVSKPRAPEEAVAAIEATLAIPGATMLPVAYDSHHDGWIC